jgi:diguanylate cyclase (GGDEF)-like protein/PAS domain S-box-containing protein
MFARRGGGYDVAMSSARMEFLWTTDRNLKVTALSARLRDLLFADGTPSHLHVSGLWQDDDPFGMMLLAHQWVLEGDRMAFETERGGLHLRINLEPLYDLSGNITGVGGCATPGVGGEDGWQPAALHEIERACGLGMWRTDLKNARTIWSPGLFDLLGIDEGVAGDLRAFDHPEDMEIVAHAVREGEIAGTGYRCDHRIVRRDGEVRHVQEQAHVLYGEDGVAQALVGSVLDVTERTAAEARVPNRARLERRLQSSLERVHQDGTPCAVLVLDIDNFKRVNETYGRTAGDQLLASVGNRLSHYLRAGDTVARLNADRFVLVLEGLHNREEIDAAVRGILKSFEIAFHIEGRIDCRVGVSIGVVVADGTGRQSVNALLETAGREMEVVKRNGGRGFKIACASSSRVLSPLRTAVNG